MYVAIISYECCKSRLEDVAHVPYVAIVFRGMLQAYVLHVSDVLEVCFIYVFRMCVASVFIWMLHVFHTYVACVLFRCCVWLQWFSSVFMCFFKCFRSMFQVFQLPIDVYCNCFFYVSKIDWVLHLSSPSSSTLSRCVLLPVSVGHPYDDAAGSFRIWGFVLLPLLSLRPCRPCVEHGNGVQHTGVQRRRPSRRPGASTTFFSPDTTHGYIY
jgi:hypothetical protein